MFTELHDKLYWLSLIFFTDIGELLLGITPKLVFIPVVKSVKMNAKTSLKPHCHCPYSLDANKKSKLKLEEYGIKSNSRKAVSVILTDWPVWLLISSRSISLFVLIWLLRLSPV